MTESAPPEAKPQEDVGKRLTPRPRRAVYVTRVDNGGVEDTVIVGDDSVSPTGRDMVDQRDSLPHYEVYVPASSGLKYLSDVTRLEAQGNQRGTLS